ncbi:MAG: glycoside hydrolase family 57 protein [Gammaproteobacteria bacterium]|nr:glycoside hydrolase family 57 protein [Gammaproteobacteria bacterium]
MSDTRRRLNVVLCWHMHQPQYRDLISGQYAQPWTYLHAIKDYVDMAAHLEATPGARAVINTVPILFEQLTDYAEQIDGFLNDGQALRDPLLAALGNAVLPSEPHARLSLIDACLRANEQRVIERFPAFARLAALARAAQQSTHMLGYLSDAFLGDLLMWYHLAWLGETVRRSDPRVQHWMEKAAHFSIHERRELLALIGQLVSGVATRYGHLAAQGQIELSFTPYAHPILPLLYEYRAARDAQPDMALPQTENYPGGAERAEWHIQQGIAHFDATFGRRPHGCWPSEGSVSAATLKLLGDAKIQWAASGESVLANSLRANGIDTHAPKADWLYRPYRLDGQHCACFFRDDELSDLIGFTYATWHADDAVANLVHRLEHIADTCDAPSERVVSIILDGENAWEYYPENGYYFLSALYMRLNDHPKLLLSTFADYLKTHEAAPLHTLIAGSWVYGTLSTWIGHTDKNRGWDMLHDAKRVFDRVAPTLPPTQRAAAERQLAVCEGSDWFWWFGDYNPAAAVRDFERLFRKHLSNLYQMLHVEPPEYLTHSFTHGGGNPAAGGTMRSGQPP